MVDEKKDRPANNRFSDNPFRDPNLTPEQVERVEERNRALRIYRETGDTGPAEAVGLFPKSKDPVSKATREVQEARQVLKELKS